MPAHTDLEAEPAVDAMGGRRVLAIHRTLRSGAAVHYDGDVHVFGDVNAGAHVRAGGSIVVFGRLRGTVHAGAQGDVQATVVAFDMAPTQIRIGKHIALAPERGGAEAWVPEIAHVADGAIVLEAFSAGRGRLSASARRSP
jgi:septum site-determining protein MinC